MMRTVIIPMTHTSAKPEPHATGEERYSWRAFSCRVVARERRCTESPFATSRVGEGSRRDRAAVLTVSDRGGERVSLLGLWQTRLPREHDIAGPLLRWQRQILQRVDVELRRSIRHAD